LDAGNYHREGRTGRRIHDELGLDYCLFNLLVVFVYHIALVRRKVNIAVP
jgi:hypothetical protein